MANTITGDKLLTGVDVKSSQSRSHDASKAQQENDSASPRPSSEVELRNSNLSRSERPLSENLQTADDAKGALAQLLQNMKQQPQQAMQAHGNIASNHSDLLSVAVST